MKNEYKYYEFDPGQAVTYLLNETIGNFKLRAVSYFLSPNRNTPDMYSCINGKFKKAGNQKQYDLPTRDLRDGETIRIEKLINTPKAIQNMLKQQNTLYGYSNTNEYVAHLYFANLIDNNWDSIYILLDANLLDSLKSKLNIKVAARPTSIEKINDLVLPYFNIGYDMLNEFVQIEYKKYQFFDEITSTLEKTITSKNKLAEEIEDLKSAHKSGLENKIDAVLQKKAGEDGPRILLSENAKKYVLNYHGSEAKLIKAIAEGADLVLKMYGLNRSPNLEIDLNYIQIHLESGENQSSAPDKKRKEKARFYLDKYEEAAQLSQKFKNKVNIKNIAEYTQPKSVQPPAVSANIGKYKNEIRYLLLSYPQKWMVLRNYFSPISALVTPGKNVKKKAIL